MILFALTYGLISVNDHLKGNIFKNIYWALNFINYLLKERERDYKHICLYRGVTHKSKKMRICTCNCDAVNFFFFEGGAYIHNYV